jgi:hypothetical protein
MTRKDCAGAFDLFAEPGSRVPLATPGTSSCLLTRIKLGINSTQLDGLSIGYTDVEPELVSLPVLVGFGDTDLDPLLAAQDIRDQGSPGRWFFSSRKRWKILSHI